MSGIGGKVAGLFRDRSLPRQFAGQDPRGEAAESTLSKTVRPRLEEADKVGASISPHCAVGCVQLVHARGGLALRGEDDPPASTRPGRAGAWGCPRRSPMSIGAYILASLCFVSARAALGDWRS